MKPHEIDNKFYELMDNQEFMDWLRIEHAKTSMALDDDLEDAFDYWLDNITHVEILDWEEKFNEYKANGIKF